MLHGYGPTYGHSSDLTNNERLEKEKTWMVLDAKETKEYSLENKKGVLRLLKNGGQKSSMSDATVSTKRSADMEDRQDPGLVLGLEKGRRNTELAVATEGAGGEVVDTVLVRDEGISLAAGPVLRVGGMFLNNFE